MNSTPVAPEIVPLTPLDSAIVEADRVIKRQKTCAARTSGTLFKVIHNIEQCMHRISDDPNVDPVAAVEELARAIAEFDPVSTISSDTKELHGAVGKLGKSVDKEFSTDICGAMRQVPLDRHILDRVVAEHLYHEGAFDVADAFVTEAGILDGDDLKAPYASMHAILEQLRQHNLAPALAWAEENREALRQKGTTATTVLAPKPVPGSNAWFKGSSNGNSSSPPSSFEFSLRRLAFLQTLQTSGQPAALEYARQHFPDFKTTQMKEIQRLMGALCYFKRAKAKAGPNGPFSGTYADLLGDQLWKEVALDFQRQSCWLMGQAQDSPLLVTTAAGAAALPTLLKLASVVSKTQPAADLAEQSNELPVEVPLGQEFVFHSIFACPVSREQSNAENPPMMLPCGHCLSKHSVLRVAKSVTRAFKCPYCPREATLQQCMELHFPDRK